MSFLSKLQTGYLFSKGYDALSSTSSTLANNFSSLLNSAKILGADYAATSLGVGLLCTGLGLTSLRYAGHEGKQIYLHYKNDKSESSFNTKRRIFNLLAFTSAGVASTVLGVSNLYMYFSDLGYLDNCRYKDPNSDCKLNQYHGGAVRGGWLSSTIECPEDTTGQIYINNCLRDSYRDMNSQIKREIIEYTE
ncbi:MAG: hypothetical protein KR126chlam5_01049 [Candidatus Anoxychlamydiales bacterium]|nr:hypothetical protein [Candidatus Anoxychlamydiales bacterium]